MKHPNIGSIRMGITVILLLALAAAGAGLLMDGKEPVLPESMEFDKLVYLSPLSSSTFDYAENRMKGTTFTVSGDLFKIDYPEGGDYTLTDPLYIKEAMDDHTVRAFEESTFDQVSLKEYKTKYQYSIYTADRQKTNFRLYALDGEVWLSSYADNTADKSEIVMYLWKLK